MVEHVDVHAERRPAAYGSNVSGLQGGSVAADAPRRAKCLTAQLMPNAQLQMVLVVSGIWRKPFPGANMSKSVLSQPTSIAMLAWSKMEP